MASSSMPKWSTLQTKCPSNSSDKNMALLADVAYWIRATVGTFNGRKHSVIAFVVFNKWSSNWLSFDPDSSFKRLNWTSQQEDNIFWSVSSFRFASSWNVDSTSANWKHSLTVVSITDEKLCIIGISANVTLKGLTPLPNPTNNKPTLFLQENPQRILFFQFPIDNCRAALAEIFKVFAQILCAVLGENANYLPLQRIDLAVPLRH